MRSPHPLLPTLVGAAIWLGLGLAVLFGASRAHPPTDPIFRTPPSTTVMAVSR